MSFYARSFNDKNRWIAPKHIVSKTLYDGNVVMPTSLFTYVHKSRLRLTPIEFCKLMWCMLDVAGSLARDGYAYLNFNSLRVIINQHMSGSFECYVMPMCSYTEVNDVRISTNPFYPPEVLISEGRDQHFHMATMHKLASTNLSKAPLSAMDMLRAQEDLTSLFENLKLHDEVVIDTEKVDVYSIGMIGLEIFDSVDCPQNTLHDTNRLNRIALTANDFLHNLINPVVCQRLNVNQAFKSLAKLKRLCILSHDGKPLKDKMTYCRTRVPIKTRLQRQESTNVFNINEFALNMGNSRRKRKIENANTMRWSIGQFRPATPLAALVTNIV